jgi:hypothetical protein
MTPDEVNEEVADLLAKLHRSAFGGKDKGRFRIARPEIALLSKKQYVKEVSITEIGTILQEKHGLFMIDLLNNEYAIVRISLMQRCRKATEPIIIKTLGFEQANSEEDDEE